MKTTGRTDLYISVDVEADGPIPGLFSMIELGMCTAATYDGQTFTRLDPERDTFHTHLHPLANAGWHADALRVSCPKNMAVEAYREWLLDTAPRVEFAMAQAGDWVRRVTPEGMRPVMVAWPIGFDWPFVHTYFEQYAPHGSPFGFSQYRCIKQLFADVYRLPISLAIKSNLPPAVRSKRLHTHNPLEDAQEQADIFCNLWEMRQ